MRSSRSASVAVMRRTSTATGEGPPTRYTSPVSNTRNSITRTPGGASPPSPRKSVPPWAARKKPSRSWVAPVYAPFLAPKSSAAASSLGMAPRLTLTKGPWRRGPRWWMARATSSLPEPVSPRMSTGTFKSATRTTSSRTRRVPRPWPSMPRSSCTSASEEDVRCSSNTTRSASTMGTPRARASGPNSRLPTSGASSTQTAVPPASTRNRTLPEPALSNTRGLRLRNVSASGMPNVAPDEVKSGPTRDTATEPSESRAPMRSRSPARWGVGWETMVSAGTGRDGSERSRRGVAAVEMSVNGLSFMETCSRRPGDGRGVYPPVRRGPPSNPTVRSRKGPRPRSRGHYPTPSDNPWGRMNDFHGPSLHLRGNDGVLLRRLPGKIRPPAGGLGPGLGFDALSGTMLGDGHLGRARRHERPLRGLRPGVEGEDEQPPVHGQENLPLEQLVRGDGLLRPHVPIGPGPPVLPHLEQRHIEGTQPLANVPERGEQSRVSREERPVRGAPQREAAPERHVVVEQVAARGMARGRADDLQVPHLRALPPVQLDDALLGDAPIGQMRSHAERHHEAGVPVLHGHQGRVVEVIVMVVGDDDGVDARQRVERDEGRVPPLRTRPGEGRGALAPEGIRDDAVAIDLHQIGGMPEPGDPQAGGGRRVEAPGIDGPRGHGARGRSLEGALEQARRHGPVVIDDGLGIDEVAVLPLGRALHAGPALTAGALSEGLPPIHPGEDGEEDHPGRHDEGGPGPPGPDAAHETSTRGRDLARTAMVMPLMNSSRVATRCLSPDAVTINVSASWRAVRPTGL